MTERTPTPLLLLDLDGTVRHGKAELGRFVNTPADVVIFPEVIDRLYAWRALGGRVGFVSNQGGVALGHVTAETMMDIMDRTVALVGPELVDYCLWCEHAPDAGCFCRKPGPHLGCQTIAYLEGAYPDELSVQSLTCVVGDMPSDEGLAKSLGVSYMEAAAWRRDGWIPPGFGRLVDPGERDSGR